MGKVVKAVIGVGLIAAAVITGGFALPLVGAVSKGFLIAVGAGLALSSLSQAFFGPKIPDTQLGRLNISNDPSTPRKAVFGTTAMNTDLVFYEPSGTDQEYIDYIIVVAAHKVASIDSIYFENNLAWSSGGGVQSKYSGFLTVATRTEGTSGNTVSISSNWGSDERLTGCAYVHLQVKRSKTGDTESPLVSGLPSRVTIIGEGALLYDPRLDTTRGGSGSHRDDDQSTWGLSYSPSDSHENMALVLLWALLGWKINSKLSIGFGVLASRIDFDSFITVANSCDENISLSAGGTQRRYRGAGTFSDADNRLDIINTMLATMNATLRDNNGKLAVALLEDDTASPVLDFDDSDIMGPHSWSQTGGLAGKRNVVRGRFTDPSTEALYQLREYPSIELTSLDGLERVLPLDLAYVEDGIRAQRIAKQVLMRNQFRGEFSTDFSLKALGCEVGDIVRVTFAKRDWTNKLFRVVSKTISFDGKVPMTLVEEDASIYAWSAEESSVPSAPSITAFDPSNNPINTAAGNADWPNISDSAGTKPDDNATVGATWGSDIAGQPSDDDLLNSNQEWSDIADGSGTKPADNASSGSNLVTQPVGDNGTEKWTLADGTDASVPSVAPSGSRSIVFQDAARITQSTPGTAVGRFFRLSAWIDTTGHTGGDVSLNVRTRIGTPYVLDVLSGSISLAQGTSWTYVSGMVEVTGSTGGQDGYTPGLDLTSDAGARPKVWGYSAIEIPGSAWSQVADDGNRPDDNADVTAENQVSVPTPAAFNIQADSAGVTTTNLTTHTRSIIVYDGGTAVTSGVTVGTTTATAGITISSASVSSGIVTVTLATANASGSVTIPVIYNSITYNVVISVSRSVAAPPQEGGSGTTSVTDGSWTNISSTTYTQVTNDPMQVDTDGSGDLEYLFSASYSGTAAVTVDVQFSTDNSSWTTVTSSETTGSAPIVIPGEEEDGFVSKAATTIPNSLSSSTTYYVRLRAKRSSGSGTVSFTGETFTVRQP